MTTLARTDYRVTRIGRWTLSAPTDEPTCVLLCGKHAQELEIDARDHSLVVLDSQSMSDGGIPMYYYHGLTRRLELPMGFDPADLDNVLTNHLETLDALADGFETVWNGSNNVGRWPEDVDIAALERDLMAMDRAYNFTTAEDWCCNVSADELGWVPGMDDDEISQLANALAQQAREEQQTCIDVDDLIGWFESHNDQFQGRLVRVRISPDGDVNSAHVGRCTVETHLAARAHDDAYFEALLLSVLLADEDDDAPAELTDRDDNTWTRVYSGDDGLGTDIAVYELS